MTKEEKDALIEHLTKKYNENTSEKLDKLLPAFFSAVIDAGFDPEGDDVVPFYKVLDGYIPNVPLFIAATISDIRYTKQLRQLREQEVERHSRIMKHMKRVENVGKRQAVALERIAASLEALSKG